MQNDIVSLILSSAKLTMNQADTRDDDTIDILKLVDETVTVTDATAVITMNPHPIKYGVPKYGLATW
jgi:hypothetical protein